MSYKFDDTKPIYLQLEDEIKSKIITGEYKSGDKIPSVREFAIILKVNPNTVQRALSDLESEKLIITKRTNGKFVTDDKKTIMNTKEKILKDLIDNFVQDLNKINISKEDIISYLQK